MSISTQPTRQFAYLAFSRVKPSDEEPLREKLEVINREVTDQMRGKPLSKSTLPFHEVDSIHFARFVLVPIKKETYLAFSTNFDGPEGIANYSKSKAIPGHFKILASDLKEGLENVFQHCEGFKKGRLISFLKKKQIQPRTFYVGSSGRSKNQILWEAGLRREVDAIMDSGDWKGKDPDAIRTEVRDQLKKTYGDIPYFPPQPDREKWAGRMIKRIVWALLPIIAGLVYLIINDHTRNGLFIALGLLAGVALVLVAIFRHKEKTDPQFQPKYNTETHKHFDWASQGENEFLGNQLSHLVTVKPGWIRWIIINTVFGALNLLARHWYNRGKLGGISSIHFARWSIIPNRGVLFFSNFDSSWQSYLGDFIDQASSGLTAVWSNTIGYPRTQWLLRAGSRDASRFLAWTRDHQLPSQVWYSAYPSLSISNVNTNTAIRRGLSLETEMEADTWLFHVRGVDRMDLDEIDSEEKTRKVALPLDQIQGIVVRGYGHKEEARFIMFQINEEHSEKALEWMKNLPITSAWAGASDRVPPDPLINIAFSYPGLLALGLDKELCDQFSTAFVQGSHHPYRTRVNGDVDLNAPENWRWGVGDRQIHVVLMLYASRKKIDHYTHQYLEEAQKVGLKKIEILEGTTLFGRKEQFGFRDGISQPIIKGSGRVELGGNTVAPGEFLLGQVDGYGNIAHSPITANGFNVGLNGSYLVFRQLKQNVEEFWKYCAHQDKENPVKAATKMVGRWPSGAPLVRHPELDPKDEDLIDDDDFTYLTDDQHNDPFGAKCPYGSHLRRSNPRDSQPSNTPEESIRLSNLHRIIRRGRPYGPPLDPELEPKKMIEAASSTPKTNNTERGLQFLAFNADLERQFEFVQQQWCLNPKLRDGNSDPDPLLGPRRVKELQLDPPAFTVQSDVRNGVDKRFTELQPFVEVVGSTYFFMPSIPALKLLHHGLGKNVNADQYETIQPDEQRHIDNLIFNLGEKMKRDYSGQTMRRDAHPKMHGLVMASFRVSKDLEAPYRVGIFNEPGKEYNSWIRFSNQDGSIQSDHKKDIRGMAIKLVNVPGYKLLDGEEDDTTHDFIGISHDAFVTKDVGEFDGLISALVKGKLRLLRFFATHPKVAINLSRSLKPHSNPLEITYFSVAPYLFGQQAVKYIIKPTTQSTTPVPKDAGDNFLREALKTSLSNSSASFEFYIQVGKKGKEKRLAIEDLSTPWKEKDTELIHMATIEISKQEFDTREQNEKGEQMSFNPWRCLKEHRPLGSVSRARRQVYRALSQLRHGHNAKPQVEPTE